MIFLHGSFVKFAMYRKSKRDHHKFMRAITNASKIICDLFAMLCQCIGWFSWTHRTFDNTFYIALAKFVMHRKSRRDCHELMRAIADASKSLCAIFAMLYKCIGWFSWIHRTIDNAFYVAHAIFAMHCKSGCDRHEVTRAIADASNIFVTVFYKYALCDSHEIIGQSTMHPTLRLPYLRCIVSPGVTVMSSWTQSLILQNSLRHIFYAL